MNKMQALQRGLVGRAVSASHRARHSHVGGSAKELPSAAAEHVAPLVHLLALLALVVARVGMPDAIRGVLLEDLLLGPARSREGWNRPASF